MTQTFKEQLLDYLTGKINMQTGDNHPTFNAVSIYQNNLYTFISDNAVQPQSSTYQLIKGKGGNGEELDEHILYGIDEYDNTGFIVVLDVLLNPIQFINTYSNGTKLGVFETLIVDDDGRFYGVEYIESTNTKRFVMLNNILAKSQNQSEYSVMLRQSYNLPDSLQTGTIKKLIKKPLANKYLFCSTTDDYYPLAVEFTINVGSANTWTEYTYTTNHCGISGAWASWDADNNITFKLIGIYTSASSGTLYVLSNNAGSIVVDNQFALPNPTASWIQAVVLNENTMYLGYCDTDNDGVYNQYIYKITNALTQIFKSPNTDIAMPGSLIKSTLYDDGINVFISFNVPNADYTMDYYMGIIYNDNVYYNNFGDLTYTTSQQLYATNTFHQFNLYTYYLQLGDKSYKALSIFNPLNYNGEEYSNINGLIPNNVLLTNNAGVPLFARNLYNRVINDNVTVSTAEIPNTLMNYNLGTAYEIAQQKLFSETNQELVDNTLDIDKNIYETVDINFYNTITMKNNNNPANPIMNLAGAIRINKGISRDIDYNNSQATKIRINYDDNTNYTIAIDPATQITINNNIATYSFVIYAPTGKNITNLEILSYDENTVYTTITGNFTQGKYYTITQDVYIS